MFLHLLVIVQFVTVLLSDCPEKAGVCMKLGLLLSGMTRDTHLASW